MTQVTWLGEDDLHADGIGPKTNAWGKISFEKGKPIELDAEKHKEMLEKMKSNRFFQVRGPGRPPNPSKEI